MTSKRVSKEDAYKIAQEQNIPIINVMRLKCVLCGSTIGASITKNSDIRTMFHKYGVAHLCSGCTETIVDNIHKGNNVFADVAFDNLEKMR